MRQRKSIRQRVEFGDWQTPLPLAEAVVRQLACDSFTPASVVEPTCGKGSFLVAAAREWPEATLTGFEINEEYAASAREALELRGEVHVADFFEVPWEKHLSKLPEPILVIGNPPWVTASELGALESKNLPKKENFKNLSGLDAITGKSNFDVSEWMVLRLLHALVGKRFTLSFLCKAIVARRVMEQVARTRWEVEGTVRTIDAMEHFGAAVDAVAMTLTSTPARGSRELVRWPFYLAVDASEPASFLGVVDGCSSPDVDAYLRTRHLVGKSEPEWRSGLKHDCSAVMELKSDSDVVATRDGAVLDIEDEFLFPFLKGSDVANERWPPSRSVIVPQRRLGEDTRHIQHCAPKTWAYLEQNGEALDARKSSIYRGQPRFAVFGIGDYTFAPWKVAIAGLYKRLTFMVIPPWKGRPVVFDDTTYFLSYDTERAARAAFDALTSEEATTFFNARIFWDDKRPINKRVLQSLDLSLLQESLGIESTSEAPRQGSLFGPLKEVGLG